MNNDIEQLREAIQHIVTARANELAGVSFDEAKKGLTSFTPDAGASLRTFLSRLQPNERAIVAMKDAGITE